MRELDPCGGEKIRPKRKEESTAPAPHTVLAQALDRAIGNAEVLVLLQGDSNGVAATAS